MAQRKAKFKIGDAVSVADFKHVFGTVGHVQYRDYNEGWYYRVHIYGGGYLTWSEKDLHKITKVEYRKRQKAEDILRGRRLR